ncbi:MAG: GMC family oxidoreductase [Methanothermobacter tenebrarum]
MVIVVGSGAGGATIARELAKNNINVTILEKGPLVPSKHAFKCYDPPPKGVDLLKTSCVGGSTLVATGNAVRVLEDDLKDYGINITRELDEIEKELNVKPLPRTHIGDGTKLIIDSARSLGLPIRRMPKFINPEECKPCGKCAFGCPRDAKWSAKKFIEDAIRWGAELIPETEAKKLIIEDNKIKGVKTSNGPLYDEIVVLAAGAVGTPRLLLRSGVNAGETFFMDTFITIGGILEGIRFNEEVQMNAIIEMENFILAPHFATLIAKELKRKDYKKEDIIGLMVKIADENNGKVKLDRIIKENTPDDIKLLARGSAIAGSILSNIGVETATILSTHPRGAHPGGTAPIGEVVDENFETKIRGLYIADASVLPKAPGAPPILTIMALALKLARHILKE